MTNDIFSAPKADLHVHLEGTIEPEMILQLAARNDVDLPYRTVEDLREAFRFRDLREFLAVFYSGLKVMRTRRDFEDVTYAFLRRSAQDNVVYTEIHFSPQGHVERGITWDEMMDGILGAAERAKREFGIVARPILGLQRHRSEESALEIIEQAAPYRADIVALGMGGAEVGNPPSKFAAAYERARALGWKCTCHAGEEGPSSYVAEALDVLKVDRIDHGIRSVEDPVLMQRLSRERMPMTVCPYSNLRLNSIGSLAQSQLKPLLEAGCVVTVNTDDPSYFGAYMRQNIEDSATALGLTAPQVRTIIENGFQSAFCDEATKATYMDALANHWAGTTSMS